MIFTTPLAFVLLLSIPLILYIGWPRQRFRRTRDIISLVLRISIVTLLILALAGTQIVRSADRLAVMFLVDASDSVGTTATENALAQVRETMRGMGENDLAGVIVFGADAQVERNLSDARELGTLRAAPQTGNTDIASAIRLALALFPADAAQRIVIFSDGQQTLGDAEAQAQLASASGVEISYVPITRESAPDVRLTRFEAPETVGEGQQFDLTLTIESDEDTSARIDIFAGGDLILSEETTVRAGINSRTLTLEGGSAGFRDFTATVTPVGADDFYQNNSLATFSQVVGPARVLLVGGADEDTEYVADALREAGLTVDQIGPSGLPNAVTGLAQYDSVILANVAAPRLTIRQMRTLQTYVRDLGGGLVTIGGPNAYGPGGYFQTPLEETLPVEMQLKDQQRLPKLTIAYLIDRSGSMSQIGRDGTPHIELAKSAIIRSIDLLQPTDRVAVVTFDAVAYWIAQFQDVNDRIALQRAVGQLTSDGGTDILAGMRLIFEPIVNEPSQLKHIIVLTDGISDPRGLLELTSDLRNTYGVTLTTVAIGDDSQGNQLLTEMANRGGGNFHQAVDIASLPLIFAQETVLATRSYIFEQEFTPTLTARNPIMQGITALPPLQGYVGTTPKVAAQVILRGDAPYQDPILAAWQYGLGRAVSFMSDATARWGTGWVTWSDFTRFWGQAARWTITEGSDNNVESRIVMEGQQARIIVDARSADGSFLNGLELMASVVDPTLGNQRVPLRQVEPGRYETVFNPETEGAYLLRLTGSGTDSAGNSIAVNQTDGWVMSYSPEYLNRNDDSVLPPLAQITNGRDLTADLSLAFEHNLQARTASQPIWPLLLVIALLLLPVDIAVRRLIITRSDLERVRAFFSRKRVAVAEGPTERLSGLFDARERARATIKTDTTGIPAAPATRTTAPTTPPAPANTIGALKSRRERADRAAQPTTKAAPTAAQPGKPAEPVKPRYTPRETSDQPAQSGSIGSRLLQKRREREDE